MPATQQNQSSEVDTLPDLDWESVEANAETALESALEASESDESNNQAETSETPETATVAPEDAATSAAPGDPATEPEQMVLPFRIEVSELVKLQTAIEHQERQVADESLEIQRLAEATKAAKASWKVSVEELSGLKAKYESLCAAHGRQLVSRAAGQSAPATSGGGSGGEQPDTSRAEPHQDLANGPPVDPATIIHLSALKITPGRLEALQDVDMGGGRNCSTISDLERLISEGRLQHVRRFGPAAVDAVTDAVVAWRAKNPVPVVDSEPAQAEALESGGGSGGESGDVPDDCESPEEQTAYRAGRAAARNGQPVASNPHKAGSRLWKFWDRGWQEVS